MNQYRKFYDYAFDLFNSPSQLNSITTFTSTSTTNQFPFYKHYFDDNGNNLKNQSSSGTFYKNKRVAVAYNKDGKNDKNSTSKMTATIVTQKQRYNRDQLVGGSQGRRVSSAKPHSSLSNTNHNNSNVSTVKPARK